MQLSNSVNPTVAVQWPATDVPAGAQHLRVAELPVGPGTQNNKPLTITIEGARLLVSSSLSSTRSSWQLFSTSFSAFSRQNSSAAQVPTAACAHFVHTAIREELPLNHQTVPCTHSSCTARIPAALHAFQLHSTHSSCTAGRTQCVHRHPAGCLITQVHHPLHGLCLCLAHPTRAWAPR